MPDGLAWRVTHERRRRRSPVATIDRRVAMSVLSVARRRPSGRRSGHSPHAEASVPRVVVPPYHSAVLLRHREFSLRVRTRLCQSLAPTSAAVSRRSSPTASIRDQQGAATGVPRAAARRRRLGGPAGGSGRRRSSWLKRHGGSSISSGAIRDSPPISSRRVAGVRLPPRQVHSAAPQRRRPPASAR